MVLEATMIVADTSEYMRNGDYMPTRLEAQLDAINLIFSAKTNSNPENAVGLMGMEEDRAKILCGLTREIGGIISGWHGIKLCPNIKLSTAISVAQLALKHRQNKSQRQRIIVFVGSPVNEDEDALVKVAKRLKKINVSVDFVNFGQVEDNEGKLESFINAINSNETSHLITVPPGPNLLSDSILSSNMLSEDGIAAGAGGSGAGGSNFEMGVDPNLDPELALALRMSLEEERARQERERPAEAPTLETVMELDVGESTAAANAVGDSMETDETEGVKAEEPNNEMQQDHQDLSGNENTKEKGDDPMDT